MMNSENRYFTNADNASLIHFQFPKLLIYGEKYKKMSGDGKLLYMICLDLIKLSMKNGWKDKKGRYYIKFSLEVIKDRMNCQNTKAVNLKKELDKFGLMKEKRIGQGKANRIYVLQLEYTDADIYKANNDHEDIENDEDTGSEKFGDLEPHENSAKQSSRTPQNRALELRKTEPIKNLITKTDLKENEPKITLPTNMSVLDDDKPASSPLENKSAKHNEESINFIISNLRRATDGEITDRSFNAVVRKVVDKYNQGKVNSFRDYLSTALVKKIEELEYRRMKEKAKESLMKSKKQRTEEQLAQPKIDPKILRYNWLENEN